MRNISECRSDTKRGMAECRRSLTLCQPELFDNTRIVERSPPEKFQLRVSLPKTRATTFGWCELLCIFIAPTNQTCVRPACHIREKFPKVLSLSNLSPFLSNCTAARCIRIFSPTQHNTSRSMQPRLVAVVRLHGIPLGRGPLWHPPSQASESRHLGHMPDCCNAVVIA